MMYFGCKQRSVGVLLKRGPTMNFPLNFNDFETTIHHKPYYFGLGFIKVKFSEQMSMNFYDPELELTALPEEIHTHRQDFTSTILGGELTNEIWMAEPALGMSNMSGFGVYNVNCKPDAPSEDELSYNVNDPYMLSSTTMHVGSVYTMNRAAFHKVSPGKDGCITGLIKSGDKSEFATVVRRIDAPMVCPYSKKLPEDELMSRIEKLYNRLVLY